MNGNILTIQNLSKSYIGHIINELDISVRKNSITALIGGNGSGKTTLFNLISRFTDPEKGSIIYHCTKQYDILSKKPYELKNLGIGRMFQDSHIFLEMSILDNMLIADSSEWGEKPFISLFKPKKNQQTENARKEKVEIVFDDLFGKDNYFWENRSEPASSLSYGQQRLLGLARLFMGDYKLILLDEPTSGVNPDLIKTICGLIKKLKNENGTTIFLIEHNMQVVMEIADWCNFIDKGRIAFSGTPGDVFGNPAVREKYLGV